MVGLEVLIFQEPFTIRFCWGHTSSRDSSHQMADAINYTIRKPLGVVALVTPWNLPLYLLTWKLGPALAMGNTIVAKPSEMTPTTATMLCELLKRPDFLTEYLM